MLVVGICDDDKIWLEESKEIIIKFAQKTKIELQIQCFSNKTQLLGYSGTPLDALFLDIELGNNENGIHLANEAMKQASPARFPACFSVNRHAGLRIWESLAF